MRRRSGKSAEGASLPQAGTAVVAVHSRRRHGQLAEGSPARKIPEKHLEGYGPFPGEQLFPYARFDVDYNRELFGLLIKEGLLDQDRFGHCSRLAFWISMRATPAFMEMEMNGLAIDRHRVDALTDLYLSAEESLK